jgi:hypothetical protein
MSIFEILGFSEPLSLECSVCRGVSASACVGSLGFRVGNVMNMKVCSLLNVLRPELVYMCSPIGMGRILVEN